MDTTHKQDDDDDIGNFRLFWGLLLLMLVGWFWITPIDWFDDLMGRKDTSNG